MYLVGGNWTISGPEFGSDRGSAMLIVRALYGLKSSSALWRPMLDDTLGEDGLGYMESKADKGFGSKRKMFEMRRRTT